MTSRILQRDSTARRLVQVLTFGAVLFHALGGCCCHHAHAEASLSQEQTPASTCSRHGHAHAAAATSQHEHESPADHACTEAPCVLVAPESDSIVIPKPAPAPSTAIRHDDDAFKPTPWMNRAHQSPNGRSSPPLRLHLLNQILLL